MLLNFKTKNFKSFKDEMNFSMIPAPKQKGLDFSVFSEKINKAEYKCLSSAVIYGPNASGKTNIIEAMDTLRAIVLRGNIRNSDSFSSPNVSACKLELIPCRTNENTAPVEFEISFIESGTVYDYSIVLDIGSFLDADYKRAIISEQLFINKKSIFNRKRNEVSFENIKSIASYLNDTTNKMLDSATDFATTSLVDDELFLTNGFKSIFSPKISASVSTWFEDKFIVICRADAVFSSKSFSNPKEDTIYIDKTITDAAKEFGINSNALGYKSTKDGTGSVLYSIIESESKKASVPAEWYESFGTIRFINEFPLVIRAMLTGATLVMDEFDASIHPMALMNVISIFHNDDLNKKHAQLIFNTHNPIFLDADFFRRDEINFVERDDNTHESNHYTLADFKTSGKDGVRKGEDYMKNYFISRYGAIKDIDFSSIFENLMSDAEKIEND